MPDGPKTLCTVSDVYKRQDVDYMKKFRDKDGISIYEAMKEYGMDPERIKEAIWEDGKIGCFLEAHIEQGPDVYKRQPLWC